MINAQALHSEVAAWYSRHARDLPWRRSVNPYQILVSEIMLQQTQVSRVTEKYLQFISAFPTIQALADASVSDVIRIWSGLGYNNRAVRLHKLAKAIVDFSNGQLPESADQLKELPGIGSYTAAAISCFAFGAHHAVLDTNIYRVLSRLVHGVTPPPRGELAPLATALLPPKSADLTASHWNQALMDIGASICTARRPRCPSCPLKSQCAAAPYLHAGGNPMLAIASVPYVAKQPKFEGSNRYYRGRIVAELMTIPEGTTISAEELAAKLGGISLSAINDLITGLVTDGLLERQAEHVRLPQKSQDLSQGPC